MLNEIAMARNKAYDEQLIMHYFREVYDDFPKGKLVKRESPDFVLKISRKHSIGIEITSLHEATTGKINHFSILIDEIEKQIIKKNEKYSLYAKNRFREYWLIIAVDSIDLPANFNLQEKLDRMDFKSENNKVFLLDLFKSRLFDI